MGCEVFGQRLSRSVTALPASAAGGTRKLDVGKQARSALRHTQQKGDLAASTACLTRIDSGNGGPLAERKRSQARCQHSTSQVQVQGPGQDASLACRRLGQPGQLALHEQRQRLERGGDRGGVPRAQRPHQQRQQRVQKLGCRWVGVAQGLGMWRSGQARRREHGSSANHSERSA